MIQVDWLPSSLNAKLDLSKFKSPFKTGLFALPEQRSFHLPRPMHF
jgi:hypothetical protein